jgi:hypothetical protein
MSLILNGTTGISDVDGTAAAPAICGTDSNTGIFFPAADRIGFAEGGVQVGEFDASSNFLFNSGYGSVAVAYGCRAWVNFNGTGTVAIRASGNVSSITDNGTGDYTVNFTTAMPDANYGVVATCTTTIAGGGYLGAGIYATGTGTGGASGMSTTAARIFTKTTNMNDSDVVCVSIFR